MSSPVQGQHQLLQWFDREPEDTSSVVTRGTHCAQQTRFRGAEVSMLLVHIAQALGMDQCIWVQVSLLPRNAIHPSLVKLSGTHNLQLESARVDVACLHNSSVELGLLLNYELFIELFLLFPLPYQA